MSVTRLIGVLLAAAVIAAATVALWPASEADKARADGERLGEAVNQLYYADSTEEVDAALAEVSDAAADSREHGGDALAEQVDAQADALSRAADGYVGAITSESDFDAELYEVELDYALDDLESQTSEFRTEAPEVHQAYWDGFEEGFEGA